MAYVWVSYSIGEGQWSILRLVDEDWTGVEPTPRTSAERAYTGKEWTKVRSFAHSAAMPMSGVAYEAGGRVTRYCSTSGAIRNNLAVSTGSFVNWRSSS